MLDADIITEAKKWLDCSFDPVTRDQVQELIDNDPTVLSDSFYRSLEFGTGGLRGIMGVGTNRMNVYTVGMVVQGHSNYLKKSFNSDIKVVIAYDCRNNSELFAQTAANVFSANGITVYLFDALRPTPELSFAVRYLGCQSGVVITASHNPKEYNGYKAYWDDGAQIVAPHDTNIIDDVNKITNPSQVRNKPIAPIITIGKDVDDAYLDMIQSLSLSPQAIQRHNDFKIVYTPIHGTGVKLVPDALKRYGFTNIINVPEQDVVDGNFPTVQSPNPEERSAMAMVVERAQQTKADVVMATDPDADRQSIAVRDEKGDFQLLNGNQSAAILTYYLCRRWKELGKIDGTQFVVKTIVSTNLIEDIAKSFGVKCYNVLTGFKYIAQVIREREGKEQFIGGGEESFGYLVGDSVRDKDAVASLCIFAECIAWAKDMNKTLWQLLKDIYVEYGYYKEDMVYITKPGQEGIEQITTMMSDWRNNPPVTIAGSKVIKVIDYLSADTGLQKSNVLQFITEDCTTLSLRPSGTEPKIKFYFSIKVPLNSIDEFDTVNQSIDAKLNSIKQEFNLL